MKNKFKILTTIFTVLVLSISLSACGSNLDFTRMSSTAKTSTVAAMENQPSSYDGKTVKAKGTYKKSGGSNYIVVVPAVDSCCPDINMRLSYNGSYPTTNSSILIEGTVKKSGSSFYIVVSSLKKV